MIHVGAGLIVLLVIAPAGPDRRTPPPEHRGSCSDAGCHPAYAKRPVVHAPVAEELCDACHQAVDVKHHRFKLAAEGGELCTECHDDPEGKVRHDPVAEGECTVCHDPHGSGNKMMLTATSAELCLSCHDEIQEATEATVSHSPVTEGAACATCHEAHASDFDYILKQEAMNLCLSCHDEPMQTAAGTLVGFKKLLTENREHHGPIGEGDCTSCHGEIHGGGHRRLLAYEYPAGFYVSYEEARFALCFDCHDADAFSDERTDDATEFRNGDRNLHFLHVNRKVKGRACHACHGIHAGKHPKQIRETAPFGEWEIPIRFEKTPTGGACLAGCHRRYRYDRETPFANMPPGP